MTFALLAAEDAYWRPSNQMGVLNTDLAQQLDAAMFGARLWRLTPGQASTRHRHREQHELYVVLAGTGRIRIDGELMTLAPLSTLLVAPGAVRQIFNDSPEDALWLVVGTPRENANTLEMSPELLEEIYPDGPRALPPEIVQAWASPSLACSISDTRSVATQLPMTRFTGDPLPSSIVRVPWPPRCSRWAPARRLPPPRTPRAAASRLTRGSPRRSRMRPRTSTCSIR